MSADSWIAAPDAAGDDLPAEGAPRVRDRLLESIGEGVFVVDRQWRLLYLNGAGERIVGAPRDRVLGRSVWEAFPTLVGTPLEDAFRGAMTTREAVAVRTVPVARRLGSPGRALFDARAYPVDDADGGGILVLFDEVTERERHVRELAERSAENLRLRELARTMAAVADSTELLDALCHAAISLCHAGGATVAAVEGATGVFVASVGHPPEVFGHRFALAGTLTGRLLDDFREQGRAALLRVRAEQAEDAAYCPWMRDGRRVGSILLAPLAAHGDLLGVLAVSRAEDEPGFTERDEALLRVVADHASLALWKARLVEEAQTASEMKSGFLATVSHELRTPLTALTGYGELLADEILGPLTGEQHDVVERMRGVTHQLTAMIEEILTFSSLEAGRETVRVGPIDLDEVLLAVRTVVEPLAAQKGLTCHTAVDVAGPLATDPDKLRQILVNLCGNAVKFTDRGEVALSVQRRGQELRFAVSDTGVGIARHDFGRLFQPFSQLDTGLTRRYGGTGLGLNISQRLAHLLGGRIEVESTPGVGSVFTLVLPAGPG